jgi:hypothetical protein
MRGEKPFYILSKPFHDKILNINKAIFRNLLQKGHQ